MSRADVDSSELQELGKRLVDVSAWQVTSGLDSIEGRTEAFGHDGVGAWVTGETSGWADTLSRLADTVRHQGEVLAAAARGYESTEETVRTSLRAGGR